MTKDLESQLSMKKILISILEKLLRFVGGVEAREKQKKAKFAL